MEYKMIGKQVYLRLDPGDDLLETIKAVCQKENKIGSFQGIGACREVVIATFLEKEKRYADYQFNELLEIASLTGNTTFDRDGGILIHAHGVFSFLNQENKVEVTGGHIRRAIIGITGEIVLTLHDQKISRKHDPVRGVDIWDFS